MPSEELRLKLQQARERKQAEALPGRLPGVRCEGYRQAGDVPGWVQERIDAFTKTTSVPDATISDSAPSEEVDRWIESFTRDHGLGTHVLLRTRMRFFPWLDCHLPDSGWATPVREALGGDLTLVAANADALVVIFEEEYSYQGFATHASPPA